MITRVDARLRAEAERLRLRWACEHCAHFAPERAACALGFPTEAHRLARLAAEPELAFCKAFELG